MRRGRAEVRYGAWGSLTRGPRTGTMEGMSQLGKIEQKARESPENLRFGDLEKLCEHYFGSPTRRTSGSHTVYRTPWEGDPRVNIQEGRNGKAKVYQVKQVVSAIDRLAKE